MVAKKSKSTNKKKRISKHVLKSKHKNQVLSKKDDIPSNPDTTSVEESKETNKLHTKAPSEAASYLQSWLAHNRNNSVGWKFNKNTQSWLVRHMYEPDKVSKTTFATLMDYLSSIKGETSRKRILAEASRRAIRYKEYEKSKESVTQANNADRTTDSKTTQEAIEVSMSKSEQAEDFERWNRLDDHDKRKEYKRARKVLDTMK